MASPTWDEWRDSLSDVERWSHCGRHNIHAQHEHVVVFSEGPIDATCVGTPKLVDNDYASSPLAFTSSPPPQPPDTAPEQVTRPNLDQIWIHVAESVSVQSLCTRGKVGAVITNWDNQIVAAAYNSPPPDFDHEDKPCTEWCSRDKVAAGRQFLVDIATDGIKNPQKYPLVSPMLPADAELYRMQADYSDCPILHAEANVLLQCDRIDRSNGTLYVTSAVCFVCAKLIAASGLSRVVVSISAAAAANQNAQRSYDLLRGCGLTVDVDLW